MCRTELLTPILILGLVACSTPRANQLIPLVPVLAPVPLKLTVRLEIVDARLPDLSNPVEVVLTNDVPLLFRNRVEIELARNGVAVDTAANPLLRVEIYDYWFSWRRLNLVEYHSQALARLRLIYFRNGTADVEAWNAVVVGRASADGRNWDPLSSVADQLERAIDDAMRVSHERGLFASLVPPGNQTRRDDQPSDANDRH